LLGNLFGAWAGGWLVDRYSDRYSKRHNGVFQPESRLHLLWIPTLIVPAGCLAFGYGGAEGLHWTALLVAFFSSFCLFEELLVWDIVRGGFADMFQHRFFGYGMVAVGLTFVPVATMTYVSDCYLPVNADALLLVNGLKVRRAAQCQKSTQGDFADYHHAEHRGFRVPSRRRWVGTDGLCELFWYDGWDFRRDHGVGDSAGYVRGED
jgi:hypothetical protein